MSDSAPPASELDRLIPPEIKGDRFYRAIADVAATPGVREILEIGSSSGAGSTEAWVLGALRNPERPRLHCIEVSEARRVPLDTVLGWLRLDLEYLRVHGLSGHGIREIKAENGIETFDAVLIDGSEFTGRAELDEVYGARFLLLDDTRTFKNWDNVRRLERDPAYRLLPEGRRRNGLAVFERAGARAPVRGDDVLSSPKAGALVIPGGF